MMRISPTGVGTLQDLITLQILVLFITYLCGYSGERRFDLLLRRERQPRIDYTLLQVLERLISLLLAFNHFLNHIRLNRYLRQASGRVLSLLLLQDRLRNL
jgi:hypothetical protein